MAFTTEKQILEAVLAKNKILILSSRDFDGDNLSACLGLYLFLKKFGGDKKVIDVAIENFSRPEKFSFLPGFNNVNSDINNLKNFILSLDVRGVKINEISYDLKDDELNFIINTKEGSLENKTIKCSSGNFKYDLIFSIGAHDFESLGSIYDSDPEFFYKVPIINIDYSPKNEQFGQINLINLTAAANSEIVFDLIKGIDGKLIDGDIATCLLAGIIDKTRSFRTKNVTPKVLDAAGQLMSKDARKEEIVSNLFRTKTITSLKLWGKALARLKIDHQNKIVWSLITKQDFINTDTAESDLQEVIEEFIISIPQAQIITLLYEKEEDGISGLINITNNHDARELTKPFSPQGTKNLARFCLAGKNLLEAEREIIENIRKRVMAQQ